ncbi:MAG: argininosuccinate lyase [Lachnospiraceae bacterium]|nr:argininosuccinate lyase [Lachnospiraceae bacterium]
MEKIWAGRAGGDISSAADDFNSSIKFDKRLYAQDIAGSIAHAAMLGKCGILTADETEKLTVELGQILDEIKSGRLVIDETCEDIHSFMEAELTKRLGSLGKKIHTARSRNDQVALDLRMYLRDEIKEISAGLKKLICVIIEKAEQYADAVMPGYTHLQRAQPVTFGHYLLAYGMMFSRDLDRLADAQKRVNISPIGCGALAGTTYRTDRAYEAEQLGFDGICENSLDGVSDRDFCVEILSALSIIMMHLSRFSEEMVLWSNWEFRFVEISDDFTTGSSMMPQKKNPDMAELVRGKTGRVYGELIAMLVTLKGLPLAYNKDMQEDKEGLFDACDTVKDCLLIFAEMLRGTRAISENMKKAAKEGFINATDLADYLVKKGAPFRDAYKVSGRLVALCIEKGCVLEDLSIEEFKSESGLFDEDVYGEISLDTCISRRVSDGGPSPDSVKNQIKLLKEKISH